MYVVPQNEGQKATVLGLNSPPRLCLWHWLWNEFNSLSVLDLVLRYSYHFLMTKHAVVVSFRTAESHLPLYYSMAGYIANMLKLLNWNTMNFIVDNLADIDVSCGSPQSRTICGMSLRNTGCQYYLGYSGSMVPTCARKR